MAEKRARRVISLSLPREQATGTHCELTGVWRSPTGASISLSEGQLIPSDFGRAGVWTYAGIAANLAANKTDSRDARLATPEHHRQ